MNVTAEKKWWASYFTGSSASTTPLIYQVTYPTIGTGPLNRIGQKIHITSFQYRMQAYLASTGDDFNVCRVIWFWWKDGGVVPTYDQILDYDYSYAVQGALYERSYGTSYKVLSDKTFVLGSQYRASPQVKAWKGRIKWPYKEVNLDSTQNNKDGNLFLMIMSDSSATPHPAMSLSWRFNFVDT